MKASEYVISKEKFVFHSTEGNIHDKKLDTKPVSYFQDALYRFARNKASIAAAAIIILLVVFAIIGPVISSYTVSYKDETYALVVPKNKIFYDLGIPFWDGGQDKEVNQKTYKEYLYIEEEFQKADPEYSVIMSDVKEVEKFEVGKLKKLFAFRVDTYNAVGAKYLLLNTAQYEAVQKYQDEHGVQIILPYAPHAEARQDANNANIWYQTKVGDGNKTEVVYDNMGKLIPAYIEDNGTDAYTSKMLLEDENDNGTGEKIYGYAKKMQGDQWEVRVNYKAYYSYYHSSVLQDGITEPSFLFGADDAGRDLFTRLASGARFSFILAIIVASVNLFVGAIYGSIEGYYGGKIDIIMERIIDLLGSIPFMIVISLLRYNLDASDLVILFISFFLTGWTGMAGRTRMQFYRFKNQEYVLVARTLGAKDSRIMFKHIFPNAIGTLITSSVLVIPGVIFSETSLSYLNIINLNGDQMTSVGTLLSMGQDKLYTHPHIILFPAIFISLLMLCFNLFGNGLRDAFNPSLRGNEE